VLSDTLRGLLGGAEALCDHIEVETYTWNVLPPGRRPTDPAGLATGLAAELAWLHDELTSLGLTTGPQRKGSIESKETPA
jgi:hypothetical protein